MSEKTSKDEMSRLDRRSVIAAGTGLAALAAAQGAKAFDGSQAPFNTGRASRRGGFRYNAPYETFRDWVAALEERGLVMRFKKVDQDAYHGTALAYRMMDDFGWYGAPAMIWEKTRIDGQWHDGPLVINHCGHWDCEAMLWGLEPDPHDGTVTYRRVFEYLDEFMARNDGKVPMVDPVEVQPKDALCKEVVLTGNDINLLDFQFVKSNPADGGRYVNTGSVFTTDPNTGAKNFGTYRCQIRGPRTIGVNPEPNQTGWKHLMAAKERGDKVANVSIVLGQDPMVWMLSGTRVALSQGSGLDELALAGGMRGKPVQVVKSETNNMLIPANAEMVIEGEVPLQEPMLPEGPFGEMYGYLGLVKEENFWMRVTAITHRRDPWVLNQFTGVTRGYPTATMEYMATRGLQKFMPEIIELHSPVEATGLTFVSIDKTRPGQGLEVGNKIAEFIPISKVVVVVDKDIDVLNRTEIMHIIGSRWQPFTASNIIEEMRGMPLDPSSPNRPMSSKAVIDATRQWPEEGGPEIYPERNRDLLTSGAPESFAQVESQWGEDLRRWARS